MRHQDKHREEEIMSRMIGALILLSLLTVLACAKSTQRPLPATPPQVTVQEFTGPEQEWPPHPKGWTNIKSVPSTQIPAALTASLEPQIRQAAAQDPRVRSLLGERFTHISTHEAEPSKDEERRATGLPKTRVTFYSYSNNVAVETDMDGMAVTAVRHRESYQPPEGLDEITQAIKLATQDERLAQAVMGLHGHAIVTFLPKAHRHYGHRVLYVAFSKEGEESTQYAAVVDLTDQIVLTAGPAAGEERRER